MDDRADIGPRLVDLAMNEALAVMLLAALGHGIAIERELADIGLGDNTRRDIARHHIFRRILVMPHADMAEAVEDLVIEEDQIGRDQIFDEARRGGDEAGGLFGLGFGW